MRTRVKICGITRPQDAVAAVRAGADAIGMVFFPPSPRAVSLDQAFEISRAIPPFVTLVGLFVNERRAEIERILRQVPIDLLQFHGEESNEACGGFGRPFIKAVRMHDELRLETLNDTYPDASGLLLDSYLKGVPGGTGQTFDWSRIPVDMQGPIILAGGLSPENVGAAIAQVRPYAVDVSGGVEQEKGIKDEAKIKAFMRGVERASQ